MNLKKFLPLLPVFLLTGCASMFTRLTPLEQPRNANNQYPVEVQFNSTQQSLRWDSLKPYVLVKGELYPLRPEEMVHKAFGEPLAVLCRGVGLDRASFSAIALLRGAAGLPLAVFDTPWAMLFIPLAVLVSPCLF